MSNVSVLNWIRNFGQKAAELRSEPTVGVCQNEIFVAEIVDLLLNIGSKKNNAGYGFLLIDLTKNSSILSSEIDLQTQAKPYFKP